MRLIETAALAALRRLDPERAHGLALAALKAGLGPGGGPVRGARLATRLAGLDLPNPVGIAAGFDKNAEAVRPILAAGPGFLEIGAVTPRPQPGNPRPRLFRLARDRAAINRFGFNNDGMEAIGRRLAAARAAGGHASGGTGTGATGTGGNGTGGNGTGVVGVNLGANKDTADKAEDYAAVLAHLYAHADFFTVNVSSPNTERLRDLQGRAALDRLLERVTAEWSGLGRAKPLFLKIAPDLSEAELADIAELAQAHRLSGLVATNTTLAREGLLSPQAAEAGGLSGAPLRDRAQAVMHGLYRMTGGALPLIGVGGIASAEDAYARIRAGASAVQLYTAMVYEGISLPGRIARGLDRLLARDGFASVADAVGADH